MIGISSKVDVVTEALSTPKLISIAVLAMGGEGGGVLADWIVDLAEHGGYFAQSTSVPGVAQRTGATIYYIEIFPKVLAEGDRKPVLALMPVPGEVDIVIASELMEAGRAVQRGLVTPDRTTLVASTHRVYSMAERIAMADGRANAEVFLHASSDSAMRFVSADFAALADKAGAVISASLFGGLAGTGALPFSREQFEAAIRRGGIGIDASLRAFASGFDIESASAIAESVPEPPLNTRVGEPLRAVAQRIESEFPVEGHTILFPAVRKLAEYQDVSYANEYLDRLVPVREIDQLHGDGSYNLLRETGRYLALWLAYEDVIRVADLKTRSTRFERVQHETRAKSGELVLISEFLSPQPQEIADLLPAKMGAWLLRSEGTKRLITRFTGGGKIVNTTSLHGFLTLYLLAQLRFLRRISHRFRVEQQATKVWLSTICERGVKNYSLAVEVAECAQLVRGYGDTHALGTRNFELILGLLPVLQSRPNAAGQVRSLRLAALADDTGKALRDAAATVSQ
jgi:indolepyruvate ferredoxin oxidoreductase, beta subunit